MRTPLLLCPLIALGAAALVEACAANGNPNANGSGGMSSGTAGQGGDAGTTAGSSSVAGQAGTSGSAGQAGAGTSGGAGQAGAGTSGSAGQAGAGTSGSAGDAGAGTSGSAGQAGAGTSGSAGQAGAGTSGAAGMSGSAGASGSAGNGGGSAGQAGASGNAGMSGAGAAGMAGTAGSGGGTAMGPCDIYSSANTPCVAAYSTVRVLSSNYTGPLYQVRKGGSNSTSTGTTGGTTQNIGTISGGWADSAAQDAFCSGGTCTISMLYDQSGKGNDLKEGPAGCYPGTASEADYESSATQRSLMISGHKVYALYMKAHEGYRNNTGNGMPTGTAAQGVYEIADGKRIGPACCWDFGNASKNNCYGPTGSMNALFFGTGFWGKGQGTAGPWFMGDFEAGVWAGGSGASNVQNNSLPASAVDYAFGILKSSTSGSAQYAIRVGNAQTGALTTGYDGQAPATWQEKGGIILGIGGDNSNGSQGTFFEGAVTMGRPSDQTDASVLSNVQAAKYGQ